MRQGLKGVLLAQLMLLCMAGMGWAGSVVGMDEPNVQMEIPIPQFSDVRGRPATEANILKKGTFRPEDIRTFWFNDRVTFEGAEAIAAAVIEAGKNPGLGVRSLHARGITGKNVRVAIIDQPKPQLHSEYKEKLVDYYNSAGDVYEMHGPAVASLLVGDQCGTAPGAKLYYAAAASWKGDSALYADALRWIVAKNKDLPQDDKIRVVSISAAPSGQGSPFSKNLEQWDAAVAEAKAAGILVLDCRQNSETGIIAAGYYNLDSPDDMSRFTPGFPSQNNSWVDPNQIYAPSSYRTQAEEYAPGENHWQYTGEGGLSWTIPYVSGVLAMGWQVNPKLTNDEILALLRRTVYVTREGAHVVNPIAFIKAIEGALPVPSPETPAPSPETPAPSPETPAPSPESPVPSPESPVSELPLLPIGAPSDVEPVKPDFTLISSDASPEDIEKARLEAEKSLLASGLTSGDLAANLKTGTVTASENTVKKAAEELLPRDETLNKIHPLPVLTLTLKEIGGIAAAGFGLSGMDLLQTKASEVQIVKITAPGKGRFLTYASRPADFKDGCFTVLDANGTVVTDIEPNKKYVLTLFIRDGGLFDLDKKEDGKLADPAAVLSVKKQENPIVPEPKPESPGAEEKPKAKSGGGGCDMGCGLFGLALAVLALRKGGSGAKGKV